MAKKKEQLGAIARQMFIDGATLIEISKKLNVSRTTLSKWKEKEGWDTLKIAKEVGEQELINNLKLLTSNFAKEIEIKRKEAEKFRKAENYEEERACLKSMTSLTDALSKNKKIYDSIIKRDKPTAINAIQVTEFVFQKLANHNEELFNKTIDFQENLLSELIQEYDV